MLPMHTEFETHLSTKIPTGGLVGKAERHLFDGHGKRVRPRLMFALGEMFEVEPQKLYDAACSVEMIHAGTLMHDDVVDTATERRSLPSANVVYGNSVAVLGGDNLLARAFLLLAEGERSQDAVKYFAKTIFAMTEGVALELQLRHDRSATVEQAITIADGKTGALFGLCGNLVGLAANDDEAAETLGKVGVLVGRAFQLRDDIDDMQEDSRDGTPTVTLITDPKTATKKADQAIAQIEHMLKPYRRKPGFDNVIELIKIITRSTPQRMITDIA
jgi:geranylgeranyl pyrophosphate synthase